MDFKASREFGQLPGGPIGVALGAEYRREENNLTDKKPPFDPMTYGAIGYNPLDYSGAIGRFFRVGLRARF